MSDTTVRALRSTSTVERERAWRALFEEQFDAAYRLAWRLGTPAADVEDVVQRAFVIAYRRLEETADVRNVAAWLRGIVVRVVADERKWRRVRRLKSWLLRESPTSTDTPEVGAIALEAQRDVARVLDAMSVKLRDVIVLVELEGLGVEEVAEVLRIPVNTVRSRRRLAREAFERLWRRSHGDAR